MDPSRRLAFEGQPLDAVPGGFDEVVLPARTVRVRLGGLLFATMRTFLLPGSLGSIRRLKFIYDEHPGAEVLVVGHTDTSGQPRYNLKLSRERAEVVAAYLRDDVEHWLAWYRYENDPAFERTPKRWDAREDKAMLSVLADGEGPLWEGSPDDARRDAHFERAVRRFQAWSNQARGTALEVDGDCGTETRRALIREYMARDDTTLPAGTVLVTHGCGENHPRAQLEDGATAAEDRRVEVFIFEGGIAPPARPDCGPGCPEYAQWFGALARTYDLRDDMPRVTLADWGETTRTDASGERKARFGDDVSLVAQVQGAQPGDRVRFDVRTAEGVTLASLEAEVQGGVARAPWRVDTGEQHPPRSLTFEAECLGDRAGSPALEVLPEDVAFALDLFDEVRLPPEARVRFDGLPQPLELVVGAHHDPGLGLYRFLVESPPQRARVTATLVDGERQLVLFRDVDLQAWIHGAFAAGAPATFPLRLPDDAFESRPEPAPDFEEEPGNWWDRPEESEVAARPDGAPPTAVPLDPRPPLAPDERVN